MALNPSIILSGQPVDILGSMARGNELAAQTNAVRDQNALRQVYQTQGAGLLAGNQSSLNALAAIDPTTAMSLQNSFAQGQETARRIEVLNAQEKRAIAEAAAEMDDREKADALKAAQQEVLKFVMAPDEATFNQMVTQAGKPELVGMFGQRQRLGALYMDDFQKAFETAVGPAVDPAALTEGAPAGYMWADPNNRALGVKPLPGVADKPQAPYTPQGKLRADLEANRISQAEYEAGMAALAPKGTTLEVLPGGGVRFTDNVAGGGNGRTDVGDTINPAGVDEAKNLIKDILKTDKRTMARITGSFAGGGGNDVEQLNAAQRLYYGEDGIATVEKLGQLGSQAWFAARDMLKGGGQITDYESKKAEAAVARLSRLKSPEDLAAALQELLDAIEAGEAKLRAAGKLPPLAAPGAAQGSTGGLTDDDLKYLETP